MKRILSLFLLLPLLAACTATKNTRQMTEADINRIVFSTVDEARFLALDREDIEFLLSISPDDCQKAWVWLDKSGTTIDEIAFFVAKEETADSLYQKLENYVLSCQADKKEWLESYNPSEAIKLQNGNLFRHGNCMGYIFLNEREQQALLSEIRDFCSA